MLLAGVQVHGELLPLVVVEEFGGVGNLNFRGKLAAVGSRKSENGQNFSTIWRVLQDVSMARSIIVVLERFVFRRQSSPNAASRSPVVFSQFNPI